MLARCARDLRETWHLCTGQPKPGMRQEPKPGRERTGGPVIDLQPEYAQQPALVSSTPQPVVSSPIVVHKPASG
jgi:hypothetical protein